MRCAQLHEDSELSALQMRCVQLPVASLCGATIELAEMDVPVALRERVCEAKTPTRPSGSRQEAWA